MKEPTHRLTLYYQDPKGKQYYVERRGLYLNDITPRVIALKTMIESDGGVFRGYAVIAETTETTEAA